jgi:hypothetical protein
VNSLEARLFELEKAMRAVQDAIRQLTQRVGALEQQAFASTGGSQGGGGGGANSYFCLPVAAVAGAGGTWPAITPASFTADVYRASGTSLTLVQSAATCYNYFPAALVASKVVFLSSDGQGNYDTVTQSCT